ncbi:unnamed protein product [Mytilus edulis]|uniref:Heat shock 70 kDa protein 12A n=1 Tax=Mytilus edulis TaxID=6550 RepID=A0A8S3VGX8_MYTED|nr:unnamed protein product [Mytilus edulis]
MGNCCDVESTNQNRPPPLPPPLPPRNRQHGPAHQYEYIVEPPQHHVYLDLDQVTQPSSPPPYSLHDLNLPNNTLSSGRGRDNDGRRTIRGVQTQRPSMFTPENFTRPTQERVFVAAIDIGTTFSGYAFSFRHDYLVDKLKISTNMWAHNSGLSAKAPSAILIGPGKQVVAFGYEAQLMYANLVENSRESDYFYFNKFKLILYNKQDLNYKTRIQDIHGKDMYAIDVFGLVISFLKNHLLDRLKGQDSSSIVGEDMIHWVLTVPAIWSDKAKQFMRKAAAEASIPSKSLTLALEPEAASLFCKTFQHAVHGNSQAAIRKGSKYLLIDLGGGTVDITAHKVHIDGTLQELYQATGGRWGGTTVDSEFQLFLFRLFGQQVMEKAYRKYPNEMLELSLDFEVKKRVFEPKQTLAVAIKIPVCLHELFYEINSMTIAESVQNSTMKHTVELKRDKMMIVPKQFYNFFDSSLTCIVNHVHGLLHKPDLSDINTILLVGGFAESHVVKEAMRLNFPKMRIVNPDDCSLSVLKGAVLFGHDPQAISSRICRYTYGIAITIPYVPGVHPVRKRQIIKGNAICDDIFDIHLRIGEKAEIGKPRKEAVYQAVQGERLAILEVFASTDPKPHFVTEDTCFELGSLVINLTDFNRNENKVNVTLHYNGTELDVVAREVSTGKYMTATLDFLG